MALIHRFRSALNRATGQGYQQIGAYFGVHFTTAGRIVRAARQRQE